MGIKNCPILTIRSNYAIDTSLPHLFLEWLVYMKKDALIKTLITIIGVALSIVIFYVDYIILGPEVTFTLLYLFPIVAVAWVSGFRPGVFVATLSIIEWGYIKFHNFQSPEISLFMLNIISKFVVFIFVIFIITQLKARIKKEKLFATHDHLTGVLNRKGFYEILEIEVYRAKRNRTSLGLAYCDIDNFKEVNDSLGHDAGDDVLIQFSKMVTSEIRKTDIFARIGGDEFVILFQDIDLRESKSIVRKIMNEFAKISERKEWPTTLSIGIGVFRSRHLDIKKMMTATDTLMYNVKKGTKNGVIYHEYKK
jgi:diguanylate cyclase (GGDEF)-like protein